MNNYQYLGLGELTIFSLNDYVNDVPFEQRQALARELQLNGSESFTFLNLNFVSIRQALAQLGKSSLENKAIAFLNSKPPVAPSTDWSALVSSIAPAQNNDYTMIKDLSAYLDRNKGNQTSTTDYVQSLISDYAFKDNPVQTPVTNLANSVMNSSPANSYQPVSSYQPTNLPVPVYEQSLSQSLVTTPPPQEVPTNARVITTPSPGPTPPPKTETKKVPVWAWVAGGVAVAAVIGLAVASSQGGGQKKKKR